MEKISDLIEFLFERKDDERVEITIDKKYGHKNFYIKFHPDQEPEDTNNLNTQSPFSSMKGVFGFGGYNGLTIHFDLRNECIIVQRRNNYIVEDIELLNKWVDILDKYLKDKFNSEIDSIIDDTFSSCYKKDIIREWKMKKILDDRDESL
jgi:hypothetical protein